MDLKIDCIIGIDPGAMGGLAMWRPNGDVKTIKMPGELMDLRQWFEYIKTISESPIVFIEKVQMRPDDILEASSPDEHRANMGKAYRIQTMLANFEKLKNILEHLGIPFVQVHPMTWQSFLHLRVKGEEKPARKKRYQKAAAGYYPTVKATLWNSDSLLLMHFGRMKKLTDPIWILENLPKKVQSMVLF